MRITPKPSDFHCDNYRKGATLNPHQTRRLKMVRRLLKSCRGRVLDYGCGYGDIAHAIAPAFTDVVGVDVNEERIAWARKEFAPIQFHVCDRNQLEFPNASFQTVISIVVINWVANPDQYLAECYRVLTPGGNLVLAAEAPDPIRSFTRKLFRKGPVPTPYWVEPLAAMRQRLRQHGFAVQQVDCFYDSLFETLGTRKQACLTAICLPMRVFGTPAFAPYYGVRAVKAGDQLRPT